MATSSFADNSTNVFTITVNGNTNIHRSSTKKKSKLNILITLFYFILIIIIIVITGVVYMLVTRLGIGNKDIDNSKYENMKAIYSKDVLEIVCELDIPAGNIAVGRDYRTFFNYHPEYHPNPIKIVEMINYNSTIILQLARDLDGDEINYIKNTLKIIKKLL